MVGRRPDGGQAPPDPEVSAKPQRRRFSAQFKLAVLDEIDRCTKPGDVGALLRRHGLYHSHLSTWRRERKEGALVRLSRKRGRKPTPPNPLAGRLRELERENSRLRRRLKRAETINEVQKKVSEMLDIPLNHPDNESDD